MDSITIENFRCFYKEQTVPLAPLTLLVGENSTGKTSFMAMIRILWDSISGDKYPDFKEEPYDLGTFEDIAHHRGGRGEKAKYFRACFTEGAYKFQARFEKNGAAPVLVSRSYGSGQTVLEEIFESGFYSAKIQTQNGSWLFTGQRMRRISQMLPGPFSIYFSMSVSSHMSNKEYSVFKPIHGSPNFTTQDWNDLESLQNEIYQTDIFEVRPFSGAPVRSKPLRTYDPTRYKLDSEGDTIPMYLASRFFKGGLYWENFKDSLKNFGKITGLFDEIDIKLLTRSNRNNESDPFQLQVRKYDGKIKGPWRNITDVGYGVSQVLPLITELINETGSRISLLQQPEIHLHPSAQAALGSLLCEVAGSERQIIVETHSDYLIDRVRMEVRDGELEPEHVSLLFFERKGLDVIIHPLRYDKEGNVLNAPVGYRKFFLDELNRSLWKS